MDQSLYIINDGEIDVFMENGETNMDKRMARQVLKVFFFNFCDKIMIIINYFFLKKAEFFGEKSFLTGCRQPCNAVSISFSTVYVIDRDTFLKILSEKQQDFVIFIEIFRLFFNIFLGKILRNER